ncbi:MAG TPA: mechanosensitive ion channel domain-containing protein, partial [Leptolyngbya sp.]|nr:mechanosensitive ion channel domain-containing protein [Leptolyngbya sp.]
MNFNSRNQLRWFFAIVLAIFLLTVSIPGAVSQSSLGIETPIENPIETTIDNPIDNRTKGTPVRLAGEEIFVVQAQVGSFSAAERAQAVTQRVKVIAADTTIPIDAVKVRDQQYFTTIEAGDQLLFSVTDEDAKFANQTRSQLAEQDASKLRAAIRQYRQAHSTQTLVFGALYAVIATIALLILLRLLRHGFNRVLAWRTTREAFASPLRIRRFELLSSSQVALLLTRIVKLIRCAVGLALFALYLTIVLSLFPWTKRLGAAIVANLFIAIGGFWAGFLSYLPNLFIVAFIAIVTYYILRFAKLLFQQLGRDQAFPWFYPEWAEPTHRLATVLITALAAVVAFPYLPGANSPAFQGVSLFLGLLVSLGSSSAISNIVAGVILIYTRAFRKGDRIKVGDAIGDVVEKTLLVTQLRTIKNVVITIPNSTVLNNQVINYSALSETETPLILHTTITL